MNEIKRVLIHIRWPLQSFTLLGFLFSVVVCNVNFSVHLVLGFISWFLLCAGIAVFNSYYDKDVNPVAGLKNPPTVTFSMLVGAWLLKLSGLIIAIFLFNKTFLLVYILGIIISVLYSHEKFRFKSNGYVAVFTNFIIGVITFIAAYSFSSANTAVLFLGSLTAGTFLSAICLMMQVHQKEEDKTRKDISIMVSHGRKMTIAVAIFLMTIAAILAIFTFILSSLSWLYVLIVVIYFSIILFISYFWLKKQEDSASDFIIMNKLTMRLSYAGNLILIIIYVLDIIKK
jgi:1,4-dihydroxy-2-naphthoate octaprenyltransferase